MAKKTGEKISIRSFDKILADPSCMVGIEDRGDYQAILYKISEEKTVEIKVRNLLDIGEADGFVEAVGNGSILIGDSGSTRFSPVMEDYAYFVSVVVFFTNIKPDIGPDRIYQMVYKSDVMNRIESCINPRQLCDLKRNIKKLSDFNISVGVQYYTSKTHELIGKIDGITNSISTMTRSFDSISPDRMRAAIEKIADSDENKIIHILKEGEESNGPSEELGGSD